MLSLIDLLEKVHSHNIYHRDIRPENLLFDGDEIVLADWSFSLHDQSQYIFAGTASFCKTLCTTLDE